MKWPDARLGELGRWYGGGTPSKARQEFWDNGSIPWLSPKDMGEAVLKGTLDRITEAAVSASSVHLVPRGSVALVVRSGILERTLPVALVPFETVLNQDMKALVPRAGIDSRWVAWGLRAKEHQILREARKTGTTVASLEMSRFLDIRLPVPEIRTQRRILAILEEHLSALSTGAASLQRAAMRLERLRRSELERSFGAVTGDDVPLGTLIFSITAGRSFGSATRPATLAEWGIIRVSSMTRGRFLPDLNKFVPADDADAAFEIRPGDLLVSRANTSVYVGASVLVPTDVRPRLLLSDKSMRITPRPGLDAEWLWRVLQSPSSRRQMSAMASGTKDSMRNISQSSLRSVIVPSADIREQRSAVEAFQGMEDQLTRQALTLDRLLARERSLRRAVLAAAFSGRLTGRSSDSDVIEELAEEESA